MPETQSIYKDCITCMYECKETSVHPSQTQHTLPYQLSLGTHWNSIINNKVNNYVRANGLIQRYDRQMKQAGISYATSCLDTSFRTTCYKELVQLMTPKPSEIEAYVSWNTERYMLPVMYQIARQFFPTDTIDMFMGHRGSMVLYIHKVNVLFDINGYYVYSNLCNNLLPPRLINEYQLDINSNLEHYMKSNPIGLNNFTTHAWLHSVYEDCQFWDEVFDDNEDEDLLLYD